MLNNKSIIIIAVLNVQSCTLCISMDNIMLMILLLMYRCGCTVSLSRGIKVDRGWSCFQMMPSPMTHLKTKSKVILF